MMMKTLKFRVEEGQKVNTEQLTRQVEALRVGDEHISLRVKWDDDLSPKTIVVEVPDDFKEDTLNRAVRAHLIDTQESDHEEFERKQADAPSLEKLEARIKVLEERFL